jgi:methyl-accepting chemotaxis protein
VIYHTANGSRLSGGLYVSISVWDAIRDRFDTVRTALTSRTTGVQPPRSGVETDGGSAIRVEDEDRQSSDDPTADAGAGDLFSVESVLDALPVAVFALAPDHEVLYWNSAAERLCGTPREDVVGTEQVSTAFYQDGRRAMTLADKVVEAPETADREYDVNRASEHEGTVYEDTSTMLNAGGDEVEIWFTAEPVYDEAGDLAGVVEMVHDRSEEVEKRRAVEELVTEVTATLTAIGHGELDARADYADERDVLEDDLLRVIDQVNETAETLEGIVGNVRSDTQRLVELVDHSESRLTDVDDLSTSQRDDLAAVVEEMESFSARMQQIAASSQQVADSADHARDAAQTSRAASEEASEATDEIVRTGEALEDRVTTLKSRIENIVDVVTVISDVAEQTNMLALNANIEAARAGGNASGANGFAVVAEEVKSLAEETQAQTDEITDEIEAIQARARETVEAVRESNERISDAGAQINDALTGLEAITESIDEAASGIEEVAEANEQQARTVEDVTTTVESVQESADSVSQIADELTDVATEQEAAADDLSNEVDRLFGQRE